MLVVNPTRLQPNAGTIIIDGDVAWKVERWVVERARREGKTKAGIHDHLLNELLAFKREPEVFQCVVAFTLIFANKKSKEIVSESLVQIGELYVHRD